MLLGNVERDARKKQELEFLGWRVIVIWECELKSEKREDTLMSLVQSLQTNRG